MKKQVLSVAAAALIAVFISGCAAKAPVMQDGKQVAMFVLSDRGIKADTKEDERKDRNEMGAFIEEDLVNALKHEGYHAMLINNPEQYVKAPENYLIIVRINDLRLVGRTARGFAGFMDSATMPKKHFEVSGATSGMALSYDDEDTTTQDWTNSPRELNERLVKKINENLVKKSK